MVRGLLISACLLAAPVTSVWAQAPDQVASIDAAIAEADRQADRRRWNNAEEALRGALATYQALGGDYPLIEARIETAWSDYYRDREHWNDAVAHAAALKGAVRLHCVKALLSEKWEWSFAEWEPPVNGFEEVASEEMTARRQVARRGRPAWWKTSFHAAPDNPTLALDLSGMSKGQIFINGRNFRRYWIAAADGTVLDGTDPVLLPPAWLRHDEPNDLLIFDEHGFAPVKVKLTAVK